MERLIIATSNKGKKREFEEMLPDMRVLCFKDLGLSYDIEETGSTFFENALIKARRVKEDFPEDYVLADDSGLEVEALGGAPGVYTARYAGENATDGENIDKLLALVTPAGEVISAHGESCGEILKARSGRGGFGYDPVFFSYDLQKGFGECTEEEKNSVSHRGRAIKELLGKLV